MKKRKDRGALRVLLIALILSAVLALICCGIYVWSIARERLDMSLFSIDKMSSETRIYFMNEGVWTEWEEERIVGERHFEFAAFDEIPNDMINAFIAIEDKRFMTHDGVDVSRSVSAALNYFLHFKGSYGASTITQQLIKNVTGNDEVSIERKIKEISFALQLEERMSKEEILELYLNIINLSDGCYGVGTAARRYFSKDVEELTLIECACIAAITNNPAYYDPIDHPKHNAQRRDLILEEMYAQGMISQDELESNRGAELVLSPDDSVVENGIHSWYVDTVIEDVISDLSDKRGISRASASRLVFGGGLNIYIQIDRDIQRIMDEYYTNAANFPSGEGAQSAMVIIDPESGDLLGVCGAIGEKNANRIQSYATDTLRSPGSVIKPLSIYAPALERGIITYGSVYDDVPFDFPRDENGELYPWPKNANGVYHGLSTMSYCVSNSTNTVPLFILDELGLSHSFYFLRDMLHLEDLIEEGRDASGRYITDMDRSALALGQLNYGISLRDIAAAYTIFADGGSYHSCRSYSRVEDSLGNTLLECEETSERVISAGNAQIMTRLLSEVAEYGTASAIGLKNDVAVACKTGTTQDNKDRWCIGYTPSLICGVWYGYEYPRTIPRAEKDHFLRAFDMVLGRIYERDVRSRYRDAKFRESGDIVAVNYCMDSGCLPSDTCLKDPRGSRVRVGYFVSGTEPQELCDRHVSVEYDGVCGGVATVLTPRSHIKEVGMIRVLRDLPMQITVSDAQYVYASLPPDVAPSFDASRAFFDVTSDDKKKRYYGTSAAPLQYNRLSLAHISASDLVFIRDLLANQN